MSMNRNNRQAQYCQWTLEQQFSACRAAVTASPSTAHETMVTCSSTEPDNDGRPEMSHYPFSGSICHLRRQFVPKRLAYVSMILQCKMGK